MLLSCSPNSLYLDFGAWVGPTAIFASSYAKHVYAMEPGESARVRAIVSKAACSPVLAPLY